MKHLFCLILLPSISLAGVFEKLGGVQCNAFDPAAHISMNSVSVSVSGQSMPAEDHPTLAIGATGPDFSLPGVNGMTYTMKSFAKARILVIVFICNHCPTSQAYEGRLIEMEKEYGNKGVQVIGINPNNPASLRLDELGYSDVGDSFEEMKIRAKKAGFNFPYLYDGATETVSRAYGPVSTPHVFILDEKRILRYQGRVDDTEDPAKIPHSRDARNAIDALLQNREVPLAVTNVFGCSIKWIEKKDWIQKAAINWAKEPVTLTFIDSQGVAELVKNHTSKLRLINVWATWCVPCVQEFSDLVTINHMFRDRGLELVTISADDSSKWSKAIQFLRAKQSSSPNFLFRGDNKYQLIDALSPKWQGALPYSILIEPGGNVVYSKQGAIDPEDLKKIIFDDPFMGRIYK